MIYNNREYGFFTYDIETGEYTKVSDLDIPPIMRSNKKERLILDFDDVWFIDSCSLFAYCRETDRKTCICS